MTAHGKGRSMGTGGPTATQFAGGWRFMSSPNQATSATMMKAAQTAIFMGKSLAR